MKSLLLVMLMFLSSCSFFSFKKEISNYSNNFKIYHYSKNDLTNQQACLEIKERVLNIFFQYKQHLNNYDEECPLYIDIKSKKEIGNSFRYTSYIDFDNFVKELEKNYKNEKDPIFLNLYAEDEIKKNFFDLNKNRFVFLQDYPDDFVYGFIKVNLTESKIETSIGEIYSIKMESLVFKGNKQIETINTVGYGQRQDAILSAIKELILKLENISDKLKPDYLSIEFSNIKSTDDFLKIYNFLSKRFIYFDVLEIKKNALTIKVPLKKSIEEISSQILSMIEKTAVEKIEPENKKIFITLNYSDVGVF